MPDAGRAQTVGPGTFLGFMIILYVVAALASSLFRLYDFKVTLFSVFPLS